MRNRTTLNYSIKPLIAIVVIGLSAGITLTLMGAQHISMVVDKVGTVLGVQTNRDKQTKLIVANKLQEADKFLTATPNPIIKISMEGKMANDPNKINTIKSLEDVKKIYTLGYAYKVTRNPKYLTKATEFILAWAKTYKVTGNSIDESHLQPLFEGYGWTRPFMSGEDVNTIDSWLNSIADKEMKVKYNDVRDLNNWNSHRINIVGQIGYLTGNSEYINYAIEAYKKQVQDNLLPEGGSTDFLDRDALHYHSYNIWPLLYFAKTASLNGVDLYDYTSASGASLRKSVHFLFPYFSGEKTHMEFVNSNAAWDKKNAKKLWVPKNDLYILELAYFFDDDTLPLIQKHKSRITFVRNDASIRAEK